MKPTKIEGCTRVMESPDGMEDECSDLEIADIPDPVWRNRRVSAWLPSDEERDAIAAGAPVMLSIVGEVSHPVVSLYAGEWEVEGALAKAL